MANADVTAARITTARSAVPCFARNNDDLELREVEALLVQFDNEQVVAWVDGINLAPLNRYMMLTLHRFIRAPKNDLVTIKLAEAWFSAMPGVLEAVADDRDVQLVQWVDSAAEAYGKN